MAKEAPRRDGAIGPQMIYPGKNIDLFVARLRLRWGDQGTPGVDVALPPIVFVPHVYGPEGTTHD